MKSGEQITKTPLEPDGGKGLLLPKVKVKQESRPTNNPKLPYMLILIHQYIKNALGKLMTILLKFSPKILTHRREIKTLKLMTLCGLNLKHAHALSWM